MYNFSHLFYSPVHSICDLTFKIARKAATHPQILSVCPTKHAERTLSNRSGAAWPAVAICFIWRCLWLRLVKRTAACSCRHGIWWYDNGDMIMVIDYEYAGSYTTQVVSPSSTMVPLPSSTVVPLPSTSSSVQYECHQWAYSTCNG